MFSYGSYDTFVCMVPCHTYFILAGPAKDESLSDFNLFSSFFFPGYLRISDCVCWTDWQNGWCFELCIQFLFFFLVSQSGQPLGPLPSSWCPMETWQNRFGSPSTSAGHFLAKVWGCGSVHSPIHPTGKAWKIADSVESLRIGR